jgi:hypothetical protein
VISWDGEIEKITQIKRQRRLLRDSKRIDVLIIAMIPPNEPFFHLVELYQSYFFPLIANSKRNIFFSLPSVN